MSINRRMDLPAIAPKRWALSLLAARSSYSITLDRLKALCSSRSLDSS